MIDIIGGLDWTDETHGKLVTIEAVMELPQVCTLVACGVCQ